MQKKINKNPMIILCGGKGKRMGEITKKIPKPLLKVGKKTIIEHKIKYYQSKGVNKFISISLSNHLQNQDYKTFSSKRDQIVLHLYLKSINIKC